MLRGDVMMMTIEEVIAEAGLIFNVPVADILSPSQAQPILMARSVAMTVCRRVFDCSLLQLGNSFNRNHTTVLDAVNKTETFSTVDAKTRWILKYLEARATGVLDCSIFPTPRPVVKYVSVESRMPDRVTELAEAYTDFENHQFSKNETKYLRYLLCAARELRATTEIHSKFQSPNPKKEHVL